MQDYHPEVGYLLYDGAKKDLDLSDSVEITSEQFETAWQKGISEGKQQ